MKKITILIVLMVLLVGCDIEELPPKVKYNCVITDILTVSAGGYGSSDKCLYETTCGKLNLEGQYFCDKQIGEIIGKICRESDCWYVSS